jgi:1-carboxybiuret hydrolase subunit AtzG-like
MKEDLFDAAAHCDHMARVLALDIRPEWRQAVIDNLAATRTIAEAVLTFPLADDVEPAAVFEP